MSVGKVILGVFGLALLWAVMRDPPSNQAAATPEKVATKPAPAPPKYDKSADAQSKREKLLKAAGAGGLVAKMQCRESGADVWVNPIFEAISFDTKSGLAVTVHQFCFSGPDQGFVRIRSNQSNKQLGMFTPGRGLDLDD